MYNSGTTQRATALGKGTDDLIVAVVDAKHVLSACSVQPVSGLPFERYDPDNMLHKTLEALLCGKFKRMG